MKLIFQYEIDTSEPITFPDIISWKGKMNATFPNDFTEEEQKEILMDFLIERLEKLIFNDNNCKECSKLDLGYFTKYKSEKQARLEELENQARNDYLENFDYRHVLNVLNDDELEEYLKLYPFGEEGSEAPEWLKKEVELRKNKIKS